MVYVFLIWPDSKEVSNEMTFHVCKLNFIKAKFLLTENLPDDIVLNSGFEMTYLAPMTIYSPSICSTLKLSGSVALPSNLCTPAGQPTITL